MRRRYDMRVLKLLTAVSFIALLTAGCTTGPEIGPEDPRWADNDMRNIEEPAERDPGLIWTTIDRTSFEQAEQLLDMNRNLGKLFNNPKQSANINSFDEVPNSSWFTNRHGLFELTPEEIAAGRVLTGGPDTTGPWLVFRPKVGGATPGFWIEDARGDKYIIKFDPTDNPEMATSAAAMGSRFFHACGYNVPQETIVYWRPEMLKIKEGVTIKGPDGEKRPFVKQDLEDIIRRVHREPDGRIRSLASLLLKNVKGPFSYSGRRKDDPNDWCRHENRRELRALYVMASLVNHYDAKDQNTLDTYEEESGRRFLRHNLIDFGSTFGSDGKAVKTPKKGYANTFDLRDALVSLVTLGLKTWAWEYAGEPQYPSIGYFESKLFRPDRFDPIYPNPAFENMTDRDAYWGAKIVMAFRDDDLEALVKSGRLSDPEAERYLLQTLIERRDKIGRHWFGKVNPLDRFETRQTDDGLEFTFEDLAVKYGLEKDNAVYRIEVRYRGNEVVVNGEIDSGYFILGRGELSKMADIYTNRHKNDGKPEDNLFEIRIRTKRENGGWSKPTALWLWYFPGEVKFKLVGVEHLD